MVRCFKVFDRLNADMSRFRCLKNLHRLKVDKRSLETFQQWQYHLNGLYHLEGRIVLYLDANISESLHESLQYCRFSNWCYMLTFTCPLRERWHLTQLYYILSYLIGNYCSGRRTSRRCMGKWVCKTISSQKLFLKLQFAKRKFVNLLSKSCFPSKKVKVKGYLLQQAFHINDSGLVWEEVPYQSEEISNWNKITQQNITRKGDKEGNDFEQSIS